jgi:futalosine hydrolase
MSERLTVVVTAVAAERDAVAAALPGARAERLGRYDAVRDDSVLVVAGGVGPAAAAAAAATAAALLDVRELVSMGVAGAFESARLSHGDVVVASTIVAADLGAMSPDRFLDLSALGLDGGAAVTVDVNRQIELREALLARGMHVAVGPVLTMSTATGTADRAVQLMADHGAVAEAMEGAGVAHVAALHDVPVVEVRTISNTVGERDTARWDLGRALAALTPAAAAVLGR